MLRHFSITSALILFFTFNVSAQNAPLKSLSLPTNTRLIYGHSNEIYTNMFRYVGGDKNLSCSLNLNVESERLKNFREVYENQVAYYTVSPLSLPLVKFKSQNIPYTYSYCVEWNRNSNDPEDSFCERYETVSMIRQYFSMDFNLEGLDANVSCINDDVEADSKAPMMNEAIEFLKNNTDLIIE